jgi:hypothetical protein
MAPGIKRPNVPISKEVRIKSGCEPYQENERQEDENLHGRLIPLPASAFTKPENKLSLSAPAYSLL